MKILMDADCLIKITKAGLKESICRKDEVVIPLIVKLKVVDAGKAKGCADADSVEKNIQNGLISLSESSPRNRKGDQALIDAFKRERYDWVATDDTKLIRILRASNIPFILPALMIYSLYERGQIDQIMALDWLERLSAFISEEEYSMAVLLIKEKS